MSLMFWVLMAAMLVGAFCDPYRLWRTWGVPLPHVGECWQMRSDGDPFSSTTSATVEEIRGDWIRYTLRRSGLEATGEVWIFRSNYRPGCADTP